jgi:hypothetical protein
MKPISTLSDDEWLALVQRAIAMPDAPPQLVQHALELWRLQRPPLRARPSLQRWVAVLSFDSWAGAPLAAGMRALPSEARQMLFAVQGFDIDLRIAPAPGGFALSGQLLGSGAEGGVELVALDGGGAGPPRRSVALDALSEFRIDSVHSGTYLITLHLGSDEIVLPPIDVGLPRAASGP